MVAAFVRKQRFFCVKQLGNHYTPASYPVVTYLKRNLGTKLGCAKATGKEVGKVMHLELAKSYPSFTTRICTASKKKRLGTSLQQF